MNIAPDLAIDFTDYCAQFGTVCQANEHEQPSGRIPAIHTNTAPRVGAPLDTGAEISSAVLLVSSGYAPLLVKIV
jgi:hypothetical protein